ncbi:MAG TPA: glutamine amidotransferase [Candidatus Saccharimonadia bacterium]|nr:glutamine amidotransferase [Candidatus Saccharimonadia bacterium]
MRGHITIAHLYPREMNIYGDMGNIITLVKRLEWRGFGARVVPVEIGETVDWGAVDLVFGGGGQDSGQLVVGADLTRHGEALREMAAAGVPMLVICGLYQLFGREFVTHDGSRIPGIGVFGATTRAGNVRMIGNVVSQSDYGVLVGFENHSGATRLDKGQAPLGRIVKGYGNDVRSRREGAMTQAAVGTYLHGPVLPKNPGLADHLLLEALRRRHGVTELEPLDDRLEHVAAGVAAGRPR